MKKKLEVTESTDEYHEKQILFSIVRCWLIFVWGGRINYMRMAIEMSNQHRDDTRHGKLNSFIQTATESVLLPAFLN